MRQQSAFSLVELSIVLVILGLLAGGILAGQSLIRAAELRAVSSEYSRWVAATQTFRDKYFALPGDMPNATAFWGVANGDGTGLDSGCYAYVSINNPGKTCNGNADGQLLTQCAARGGECTRYWEHLAYAGLIEGVYEGGKGSGTALLAGSRKHAPSPRLDSGAMWFVYHYGTNAGAADLFAGNYGNSLFLHNGAGFSPPTYDTSRAGFLRAEEAWNLDQKMDDGAPAIGQVVAIKGSSTYPCTSRAGLLVDAALDAAATYNFTASGKNCTLIFARSF